MDVPYRTKNRTSTWSSNPTPGHIYKKTKALIKKDTCIPMFIAALFTIARTWKKPKCPSTDEWIKKMWYVYIYMMMEKNIYIYIMEYYSAIKMNEIMSFVATWTDLEIIMLSEVSQAKANIMWYHLYVEPKKMVQMNLLTVDSQTL